MNRVVSWLKNISLRQIVTVFLAAMTMLVIPAFGNSQSMQAQADVLFDDGTSKPVDTATVKRIQEKAEDLGNSQRPIGDTGLKNIRKLGENIPETLELNYDQKVKHGEGQQIRESAEKAVKGVKKAID